MRIKQVVAEKAYVALGSREYELRNVRAKLWMSNSDNIEMVEMTAEDGVSMIAPISAILFEQSAEACARHRIDG